MPRAVQKEGAARFVMEATLLSYMVLLKKKVTMETMTVKKEE